MSELIETLELLTDKEMLKKIRQGQTDIKAGRIKELHTLLKEETT
jgi:PHD/YefM family antitoxin component YafN of YafNO toxin-antitoxin module